MTSGHAGVRARIYNLDRTSFDDPAAFARGLGSSWDNVNANFVRGSNGFNETHVGGQGRGINW